MSDPAPTSRPNLALPTLGGKQLWADRRWQEGWRIQQNVLTGHHRLLDSRDRRQAWGSLAECEAAMVKLAPPPPDSFSMAEAKAPHLVILLHGMGRSRAAFSKMQQTLQEDGFYVASISYPSTRRSIEEHAAQLAELLEHIHGYGEVSFVSHSLGGIVLRCLFAHHQTWRKNLPPRRIVMLGPPNQGSSFAAHLESFAPFRWLFGQTGTSLTPEALCHLPAPDVPFLVIAGSRGTAKGWNPWLEGDDDFVVRVEETHLDGEAGHLCVHSLHTFLMNQDDVITAVEKFL